jgi:hypothetical protein
MGRQYLLKGEFRQGGSFMKITWMVIGFVLLLVNIQFSQDKGSSFYSQLIGFKGGGEFYVSTFLSDWSSGVFFENVINPWLGLEIELNQANIPVTNYLQAVTISGVTTTNTFTGDGEREYIELGGALKFYIKGLSISLGMSYNNFMTGNIIVSGGSGTNLYEQMSDKEKNYFSFYGGPELTAQISSDLFAKVGVKCIYGLISDPLNYTFGARFYIAFAYGI